MESKDLLKINIETCSGMLLQLINDMKDAPLTFPTSKGGPHPLWVLGNVAFSEAFFVHVWILGGSNPLEDWAPMFGGGTEPTDNAADYPSFNEVMARFKTVREDTLKILDTMGEGELDGPSGAPENYKAVFGTKRQVFLMVGMHALTHRGQVADARRSAGRVRLGP